jgi:hypothetical protein
MISTCVVVASPIITDAVTCGNDVYLAASGWTGQVLEVNDGCRSVSTGGVSSGPVNYFERGWPGSFVQTM